MTAASVAQDRTTSRVALCSAIFAGFAYVGYAVVRQAFGAGRNRGGAVSGGGGFLRNEDDVLGLDYEEESSAAACSQHGGQRIYLRRLSGSTAAANGSAVFDSIAGQSSGRCILRPMSVRERIRELNLSALAFADTMLVLQGKKALSGPRSLQSSPFHSPPRIVSPLDLRHFPLEPDFILPSSSSPAASPKLSRRASRRNLSRRSLASSFGNLTEAQQEEADARAENLLQGREAELTSRLEQLQQAKTRELTPYESKVMVALLHSADSAKVARTLVTVANAAAFTRNQDSLREAGILVRLPSLLASRDRAVAEAAVVAAANLSLNVVNMKEMEQCVAVLVLLAETRHDDPELELSVLECLTNMAVLPDWHHLLGPLLPRLLAVLDTPRPALRLQALRLLINLSCSDDMVAPLLEASCSDGLTTALLHPSVPEEELLRSTTFLGNLCVAASRLGRAEAEEEDEEMSDRLQARLFHRDREDLIVQTRALMEDEEQMTDIRLQARRIHTVLFGLRPEP